MAADTAAPTIALFAPAPPMGHSAATAALPTPPSSPDHHQRTALSSFSSSSSSSSSEAAPAGKADDNRRSLLKLAARPLDTPPVTPSASQLGLRALEAQQLAALNREFAQRSPLDILLWLQSSNLGNVVQFTSFGLSGMVITDLMAKLNYDVPIAFVDTLHHFEETLALRKNVLDRYGRIVQSFGPGAAATREEFIALYGERLWETDPDFYQYLTKVEPTARALEQFKVDVWITGRRRSQGDARSTLQVLELTPDGRLKVNPLAWVPWDDVSDYVSENDVPYNALLDQGYRSIGDYHSTSPAGQNAPERAGRWSGSFRTECGMHSLHGGAGSRRQGVARLNSDSTDEEADAPNDDLPTVVELTLGAAEEDDDEDNSSGDEAQVASPDHHRHLRR